MFRRGGGVARNTGIVSGFENGGQVRKYYHDAGPVHNEQYGAGHESHPLNYVDPATDPEVLRLQGEALPDLDRAIPDLTSIRDEYLGDKPERGPGLSVADWLRIAGSGFEIMGAPYKGTGLKGYLASASPSLSKLGGDLATSIGARESMHQQRLQDWKRSGFDIAKEEELARTGIRKEEELARAGFVQSELESRRADISDANKVSAELFLQDLVGKQKMDQIKYEVDNKRFEFSEMLQARVDLAGKETILKKRLEDGFRLMPDGTPIEDEIAVVKANIAQLMVGTPAQEALKEAIGNIPKEMYDGWYRDALTAAEDKGLTPDDEEYWRVVEEITTKSAQSMITGLIGAIEESFNTEFAEGGRVGYANGGASMPMVDPNATQRDTMTAPPTQQSSALTFQELRRRLPPEVSDKVITLIVSSEEALMDFAQIQTPEDVARFNQKYNADLVLPVEVA